MSEQRLEDLHVVASRRLVVHALLRASLTVTVLVLLYFTLPMTGSLDGSAAVLLTVGLLAFVAVVAWQIRAVLRSLYPGLRAVEALAAAIPLFLLVFAAAYVQITAADPGSFSEQLSRTDALYFTITVFATVGFGDITPRTGLARIATMIQMVGDLAGRGGGAACHGRRGQNRPAAAGGWLAGSADSSRQGAAGPVSNSKVAEQDGSGA